MELAVPSTVYDKMIVMARNYWLDLFTVETWEEFRSNGSSIPGLSESSLKTVHWYESSVVRAS